MIVDLPAALAAHARLASLPRYLHAGCKRPDADETLSKTDSQRFRALGFCLCGTCGTTEPSRFSLTSRGRCKTCTRVQLATARALSRRGQARQEEAA